MNTFLRWFCHSWYQSKLEATPISKNHNYALSMRIV
jgi:hypothetical protein